MSLGGWLRDHPAWIEWAYDLTQGLFRRLHPLIKRLGYKRVERVLLPVEDLSKKIVFDCRTCGQCILHSTGMTCPMTCPKNLRNGPCGGVRANGNCEVKPQMRCVWVEAYERSKHMNTYGHEIIMLQPPVDRRLVGTSAWINMLSGADQAAPPGWGRRMNELATN